MQDPTSDQRVLDLVRAMGGGVLADDAALRELVPGATGLEIYAALTALRDVLDERRRQLFDVVQVERFGGVQ